MRAEQEKIDALGPLVKKAREQRCLLADNFAEQMKIGTRHLSDIENNHSKPSYWKLYEIVRFLGLDANAIFYPERGIEPDHRQQLLNRIETCDDDTLEYLMTVLDGLRKLNKGHE